MRTKKLVSAVLLSLAGIAATAAHAQQFSNVVVFGDSLSDAGYFRPFLTSIGIPSTLVPVLGRFTTNPGPVWSEAVSTYYGVTNPGPSNAGGSIYAQGGARVALTPGITPPGVAERPISTQITEYLARHGGAADRNALFAMWGGANDFLVNFSALQAGQINATQLQNNVLAAVTAEIQQVGRLYAAGARYVMVVSNYDPAITPRFAGADAATRAAGSQLAVGANTTLWSGLASAGLRVIPVDIYSLMNELVANPSAYGFTNITGIACGAFPPITTAATASSQFCYGGNLVAPNADRTYMFADTIHPTTATHQIFAQFAESLIDGPAEYSLMAESALRTRASHMRTVNEGLVSGSRADIGRWTLFAAGDHGNFDINPSLGVAGLSSRNNAGSVGLTGRISETVTVGIAAGRTEGSGSFGGNRGGFDTRDSVFSLFGTMNWAGFYATAIVSLADLKFRNVQRNIVLGNVTRVARAEPSGSNSSAFVALGYDANLGRFTIGPVLSVNTQNVDVNAFDETGAGSAGLHLNQQKLRSEVWSGGVRATLPFAGWTPWARLTFDHERQDQSRVVTAMPLTLTATGNTYDIPAYIADRNFTTWALGVNGTVAQRIGLSVAYYKVSNRGGIKEDGVTGMLSYRF